MDSLDQLERVSFDYVTRSDHLNSTFSRSLTTAEVDADFLQAFTSCRDISGP